MSDEQPRPTVSTAPAEGGPARSDRRRLPPHIGPARTSTVLLLVAFLAIGVLYLFVKPPLEPATGAGPSTTSTTNDGPAPTTAPGTSAPATTAPESAAPEPELSEPAPTSEVPDETTPEAPEETVVPTTPEDDPTEAPTTAPPAETAAPTS